MKKKKLEGRKRRKSKRKIPIFYEVQGESAKNKEKTT